MSVTEHVYKEDPKILSLVSDLGHIHKDPVRQCKKLLTLLTLLPAATAPVEESPSINTADAGYVLNDLINKLCLDLHNYKTHTLSQITNKERQYCLDLRHASIRYKPVTWHFIYNIIYKIYRYCIHLRAEEFQ